MNYKERITTIIKSNSFKNQLENINDCFFNMKQEINIRNLLLQEYRMMYNDGETLILAEYPRGSHNKVDLSIININDKNNPYLIELKYYYPGDFSNSNIKVIIRDIELNKTAYGRIDLFILIIQDWQNQIDNYNKIIDRWGLQDIPMVGYQKNKSNINRIVDGLQERNGITAPKEPILIDVNKPINTKYYFYLYKLGE